MMDKIIIHVDMDAFYAAVEVRDNPDLAEKPLIIGALPTERGVVSTCSYEARRFGIHSAMSIKEAYRLCPHGIYMHPNHRKYTKVSSQIHAIWSSYTDLVEYISLDEGFLDVTGSAHLFGGAEKIGHAIKRRTKEEVGLTCSVGIGYSMMSAKLASEEKKPDGFFQIPTSAFLKNLICKRDIRTIYGIGKQTAAILNKAHIYVVDDILNNSQIVIKLLGNHGNDIVRLANGMDDRRVTPDAEMKSIGKERTFQQDTTDISYLKDYLRLIAKELSLDMRLKGLYSRTITLKVKYSNMQSVTRSKSGDSTNKAEAIYQTAVALLETVDKRPVRLIGISLSHFTDTPIKQLDFENLKLLNSEKQQKGENLDNTLFHLHRKYGGNVIKTASELRAEKRLKEE